MLERLKDLIANNFIAKKIQEKNNILLRSRKEVEINGNGTSGYTIKEGSLLVGSILSMKVLVWG